MKQPPRARDELRSERRFWRRALRVGVALLALVVVIAVGRWATGGTPVTGEARWIWASVEKPSDLDPVAFFALRDFTVDRAPAKARLLIQAEEEYRVWINGRAVGSGVYRQGAALDAYAVSELLLAGDNRLLVELRSSFGGGGLIARLEMFGEDGALAEVLLSDASWRVVRQWDPGLIGGWSDPAAGESARDWGKPPIGRWGAPPAGAERPALALVGERPGLLDEKPAGSDLSAGLTGIEAAWSTPVTGYLMLDLEPESERIGVVAEESQQAPVQVVAALGASRWVDAEPRTWSRATVFGLDGVRGIAVAELPPAAPWLVIGSAPPKTLLGIHAPSPRTPLMQRVRRALGQAD